MPAGHIFKQFKPINNLLTVSFLPLKSLWILTTNCLRWRQQKLLEEKLQTGQGKFLVPKIFDAWMQTSVTFQSSRWAFRVHHEDFLFVIFLLFHYEISRNLRSFLYHCTLFFIPMKATSHLASSSCRNFGTRSLNRQNSEVAY